MCSQPDRLILILVEGHIGSGHTNVINLWRSEIHLLGCGLAQVKRIYVLVKHRLLVLKLTLFLLTLIHANQALVEDAWSDAKLELVLFDLVIKELYYADVWTLFLLNIDTDISGAELVLL